MLVLVLVLLLDHPTPAPIAAPPYRLHAHPIASSRPARHARPPWRTTESSGAWPQGFRDRTLPAQLQSDSIAMHFDRVDEVIRAELGGVPDALLESFEREPFAAASIGQVHRAHFDVDFIDKWKRLAMTVQDGFEHRYLEESYGKLVFDNPNKLRLAMPRPWLLLNRLQWGLFAVLSHMRATGPWPDLFRAALESTSTPART